jgi:hypothetical protein
MPTTEIVKLRKVRSDKGTKRSPKPVKEVVLTDVKAASPVVAQPAPQIAPIVTEQPSNGALKFIDKQDRLVLSEGRNYGVGFALCKRTGDTVETVGPISPCKDYMNDQVYSERTGKPYRAWGYSAKKCDIFDGKVAYIAFGVMPYKGSSGLQPQQVKECEFLAANFLKVQEFINQIETLFKLEGRTSVQKVADNRYVATVPDFWVTYPCLVSLWSLLVRFAIESFWVEGDVLKAIDNCTTSDGMMLMSAMPKMKKMIAGTFPKQNYEITSGWHDAGIVSVSF